MREERGMETERMDGERREGWRQRVEGERRKGGEDIESGGREGDEDIESGGRERQSNRQRQRGRDEERFAVIFNPLIYCQMCDEILTQLEDKEQELVITKVTDIIATTFHRQYASLLHHQTHLGSLLDAVIVFNEEENEEQMSKVLQPITNDCYHDERLKHEIEQAMFLLPNVVSDTIIMD